MKKLIGFLIVAALAACTCLSQIPDQLVYVDQNCEAILPDYTSDVVITDNCDYVDTTQVPVAGTMLTSAQPTTQVVITATDISGNYASISFNVVLVDTIAPTIQAGPGLLTYNFTNFGKIHNVFHQGMIAYHDTLRALYPETVDQDTSYRHDKLLTISNLNSRFASTSFVDPDALIFSADSAYLVDQCGFTVNTLRLEFIQP